jgi:hypothetical protein
MTGEHSPSWRCEVTENNFTIDPRIFEGPFTKLDIKYIDDYLESHGYKWSDLCLLPEEEAKKLMVEASRYATMKLAEQEARAKFRKEIHYE